MYGPLITFEIKVNPNTHGGTGRVNPIPIGASDWNGPPYQENCLFVCFFCFFFDLFHVSDPIFHQLKLE